MLDDRQVVVPANHSGQKRRVRLRACHRGKAAVQVPPSNVSRIVAAVGVPIDVRLAFVPASRGNRHFTGHPYENNHPFSRHRPPSSPLHLSGCRCIRTRRSGGRLGPDCPANQPFRASGTTGRPDPGEVPGWATATISAPATGKSSGAFTSPYGTGTGPPSRPVSCKHRSVRRLTALKSTLKPSSTATRSTTN